MAVSKSTLPVQTTYHLYEHQSRCRVIAFVQLLILGASFIFTMDVWWATLIGFITVSMGIYGSSEPVSYNKVGMIHAYKIGNWFFLVGLLLTTIYAIMTYTALNQFTLWMRIQLYAGTTFFILQMFTTFIAIKRSSSFYAELIRNPPPESF